MKEDKHTREKLLSAAREEFMEKGYNGASLRSICKKAEVTTGALYFFFRNKEDLFGELIREPIQKLTMVMNRHYDYEISTAQALDSHLNLEFEEDFIEARKVLEIIYDNFDAFYLALVKSEGSTYENILEEFAEVSEKHYRKVADLMSEALNAPRMDDYMLHWISRLQIEAFARLVEHRIPREQAQIYMEDNVKFLINGFMGMF